MDLHVRLTVMVSILTLSFGALCAPAGISASKNDIPWLWDRVWRVPPSQEVSLLMENIELRGSTMTARGRTTAPIIPSGTVVTPLIHVEVNVFEPPKSPERFNDKILEVVLGMASRSTSGWVQLDYEARPSGQQAYKDLVRRIRDALPKDVRLSVTALAWWCRSSSWLDDLQADEVVPMFFRMGRDSKAMKSILSDAPERLHPKCRTSVIGISKQEPVGADVINRYQKRYWFDNTAWK
jgi:hypothetical protein